MLRLILLFMLLLTACAAPPATVTVPDEPARPTDLTEDTLPENTGDEGGNAQPASASGDADPEGQLHPGAVIEDDTFVNLYGEIENTGQRWLHNIQVVVTYYDAAGKEIYQDKVPTEILFAGPGERVPFYVVTDKARMQGTYASHKIQYRREANDTPGYRLEVSFEDMGISFGIGEVAGTVRNPGQSQCGYPTVAVAYYDSAGKVAAVSGNYLEVIAPGKEASFKLLTMNVPAQYDRVKVWAACREVDE